jgi:Bacterial antitoxin of type II TA system, VapB
MSDDLNKLIETAKLLGGHKTKKAAVTAALEEYVLRRKRQQAVEAFGTVDFEPAYDYKAEWKAKRW